jgi:hypothetical protein
MAWTESQILALLGQPESIRREYKAGQMFDQPNDSKWVENLSKETSALANTEGGEIFLGIVEDKKSKPKVAAVIDGVPISLAPERLQQLIEGNMSPYLPGMRVHRVRMTNLSERVVYVIHVPQGSTAYQANDGKYYGRSEFEAKYLPDHEIRLRMNRGKVSQATVELRKRWAKNGADFESEKRKLHAGALEAIASAPERAADFGEEVMDLMAARHRGHELWLDVALKNSGEQTIRHPLLELRMEQSPRITNNQLISIQSGSLTGRFDLEDRTLYPDDECTEFKPLCKIFLKRDAVIAPGEFLVRWKVFLDNSPPSTGAIDAGSFIRNAFAQEKVEDTVAV